MIFHYKSLILVYVSGPISCKQNTDKQKIIDNSVLYKPAKKIESINQQGGKRILCIRKLNRNIIQEVRKSHYIPERRQVQAEIIIFKNWNRKKCKISYKEGKLYSDEKS